MSHFLALISLSVVSEARVSKLHTRARCVCALSIQRLEGDVRYKKQRRGRAPRRFCLLNLVPRIGRFDQLSNWAERSVRVIGKGDKERLVPLTPSAAKTLDLERRIRWAKPRQTATACGERGMAQTASCSSPVSLHFIDQPPRMARRELSC
jgi:hypothetical protein